MKLLIAITCSFLLAGTAIFAQNFRKVSDKDLEQHFLSNREIQSVTKIDSSEQRKGKIKIIVIFNCKGCTINARVSNPSQTENSGIYTINNATGKEDLLFITYRGTDNNSKKEISINMLKSLTTGQVSVWAGEGSDEYRFVQLENSRTPELQKNSLANARVSLDKIQSCYNNFKKAGAPAACSSCVNCLKNCSNKPTRAQRISCALSGCSGSCFACVTSVYNFITCIF